jgi:tetratricopeptide (TPR) repeat protein
VADANGVLRQALDKLRAGRAPEAEIQLRELLREVPGHAQARQLLGIALLELGRPRQALIEFDAVAPLMPSPQLHFNRGNALAAMGRLPEAAEAYGFAAALQPDLAQAHLNAASALRALGRMEKALVANERAVAAAPTLAAAWQQLGAIRLHLGRDPEAIEAYDRALSLDPRLAVAHNERGVALHRRGDAEGALAAFEKALALDPDDAPALNNRGNALHDLRRMEAALRDFDAALRLRPDFPEATCNRGMVLQDLRRFEEAEGAYEKAMTLRPRYAEAMRRRASLRLLQGRFAEGWADYEQAHEFAGFNPHPGRRWWRGEPLAGRSIVLTEPNGIGDMLQFLRFVPGLFKAGASEVALAVPARFRRLLSDFDPRLKFVEEGSGSYDFHSMLWSLPHWLGVGEDVGALVPYLRAEPEAAARWARVLDPAFINIGIAWQGNPARRIDRGRSIPLAAFAPLARVPGVRLVSLQKNFGLEQLASLPAGMLVFDPGPDFDEGRDAFVDSAALLENLDLVISSDTSLPHRAGALARPAWLALGPVPEWRWQLGRSDSPWYPDLRLFRQQPGEGWSPVFEAMAQALAATVPALRAARTR